MPGEMQDHHEVECYYDSTKGKRDSVKGHYLRFLLSIMSQLIQITFNEPIPVGDEVYPEGYRLLIPAEQVFGSHARRQLAPFDLFDSGLELVRDLDGGFYRLAYNMDITIGPRTI